MHSVGGFDLILRCLSANLMVAGSNPSGTNLLHLEKKWFHFPVFDPDDFNKKYLSVCRNNCQYYFVHVIAVSYDLIDSSKCLSLQLGRNMETLNEAQANASQTMNLYDALFNGEITVKQAEQTGSLLSPVAIDKSILSTHSMVRKTSPWINYICLCCK